MKEHRRSKIFFYTKITASLPFIETNLNLTTKEISMFLNGLKYITPCQSRFQRRSKKKMAKNTYETLSEIVKKSIDANQHSISDERAQQAFSDLEQLIHHLYTTPLPWKLYRRARREHKQVKRLQNFLRHRPDIIVCQVDKSPGFYIGDAATIELKAYDYMKTTKAYTQIKDNRSPLADSLHVVQTLLQDLLQRNAITKELYNRLNPKIDKLELAHLHGLPKVHKVTSSFFCFKIVLFFNNFVLDLA